MNTNRRPSADVVEGEGALLTGWKQSKELRELRRVEYSLRARLLSIEHDTWQALCLYEQIFPRYRCDVNECLPLFGNLRAGGWYVPPSSVGNALPQTHVCSFKSADGHYGKWASSLRRPNLHVLTAAAKHGGVVIVDVTRRGKVWPDSLSKTVPIWCTIVNILAQIAKCECGRVKEREWKCCACMYQVNVHPSVPNSERSQINALVTRWLSDWQCAALDVRSLLGERQAHDMKPLRPVWVRPGRPLWQDGLPSRELAFAPVLCISASTPPAPDQRAYVEPRLEEHVVCGVTFPKRATGFSYIPGAGDDEDTWSKGLRPDTFWKYRELLLSIPEERLDRMSIQDDADFMQNCTRAASVLSHADARLYKGAEAADASSDKYAALWKSRVCVSHVNGATVLKEAQKAAGHFSLVIVLGTAAPSPDSDGKIAENADKGVAKCVPLNDKKGKTDYKYGFGRALGPCLAWLRECCAKRKENAFICCADENGDWSVGLAIAWLTWHCDAAQQRQQYGQDDDGFVVRVAGNGFPISKQRVQAVMLSVLAARPDLQLSRATLKQLNRFFQSPCPSSTVE